MIVVTGGAGFIGQHLVDRLSTHHHVRVIEHPKADVSHLPRQNVEIVRADIVDRQAVRRALAGAKQVYHLAANPNLWTQHKRDFDSVNHQGTRHVLTEALDQGADRVLYTSTESILTSSRWTGGSVENVQLQESDMLGPYCLSKYRAERFAFSLAQQNAPVVVAAPTLPVGPGDRGLSPPTRMTVAFCQGKLPAYLDCQLNMIDVRDIACGLENALTHGTPGKRYLLGFQNVRLIDWLQEIGHQVKRTAPKFKVPYRFALLIAHLSEWWANSISHRMPQATITGVRLAKRCMHFDPAPSLQELKLTPRPLQQSAHDAVTWYKHMGWVA